MFAQPGWLLYISLFFIMVLLPVSIVWSFAYWRRMQLRPVLWSLVLCSFVYLSGMWGLQQNHIQWTEQRLLLQAGIYRAELTELAQAGSAIETRPAAELGGYQPQRAIDGIRLPGYHVGWYVLKNQQTAFVMLIGDSQEVSIVRAGGQLALVSGDLLSQNPAALASL